MHLSFESERNIGIALSIDIPSRYSAASASGISSITAFILR